jgi:hypothetical protein
MATKLTDMLSKMGPPPEDDMEMEVSEVSFMPPQSFRPPDDAKDGREWEQMVTVKKNEDGSLVITKVGGIPLGEVAEDYKEEDAAMEMEEEQMDSAVPADMDAAISAERSMRGV